MIEISNDIDDIYKKFEECNPNKKDLIVFDDVIADMLKTKKLNPITSELFTRGRILNIGLVFIRQSYFTVPKNIRLNSSPYFVMKIQNKQKLQQSAVSHWSDIDFQDFMNLYKKCTVKPYLLLVIIATLAPDNSSPFKRIF